MAKKASTDDQTLRLMKEVEKQKAEISKAERNAWTTNCSFSYTERSSDAINLHVEKNIRNLISIAAFLQDKEKSYKQASQDLAVADPPEFTWQGYSVKDWLEDLKIRITKIQIEKKKSKLETLQARLNAIVSPELRAKMELAAIADELN